MDFALLTLLRETAATRTAALAAGADVALEPVALAWGPSGMLSSPPPAHPCAGDAPGDGRRRRLGPGAGRRAGAAFLPCAVLAVRRELQLPLWFASYVTGGVSYGIVINANTGEVVGDRPYSKVKIALVVLAVLVLATVAYML